MIYSHIFTTKHIIEAIVWAVISVEQKRITITKFLKNATILGNSNHYKKVSAQNKITDISKLQTHYGMFKF